MNEIKRKSWLGLYCEQQDKEKEWPTFRERFLCPCCYIPTLTERNAFTICPICLWEDDGQDTDDQSIVRVGPNTDYSSQEARDNFQTHMTMYRKEDVIRFDSHKKEYRRLMIYMTLFIMQLIQILVKISKKLLNCKRGCISSSKKKIKLHPEHYAEQQISKTAFTLLRWLRVSAQHWA